MPLAHVTILCAKPARRRSARATPHGQPRGAVGVGAGSSGSMRRPSNRVGCPAKVGRVLELGSPLATGTRLRAGRRVAGSRPRPAREPRLPFDQRGAAKARGRQPHRTGRRVRTNGTHRLAAGERSCAERLSRILAVLSSDRTRSGPGSRTPPPPPREALRRAEPPPRSAAARRRSTTSGARSPACTRASRNRNRQSCRSSTRSGRGNAGPLPPASWSSTPRPDSVRPWKASTPERFPRQVCCRSAVPVRPVRRLGTARLVSRRRVQTRRAEVHRAARRRGHRRR